jgi:enoyl-CoA hydratase
MAYEYLVCDIENHVALVTINRPEKLNALNAALKRELSDLFENLKTNENVYVVILTGAGEKSFVAGTDIGELLQLDEISGKEFAKGGQDIFSSVENLGKPVIAAVNGFALGGGCELALACTIRIAAENARFGQPEVNLGIIPGYGGTQRLPRLVGKGVAYEMILTGNHIDANEALRIGLVNKVVPRENLIDEAKSLAAIIAKKGQIAVRYALQAVHMNDETKLSEGLELEATLFGSCAATEDSKEGVKAFLEKRKPDFKNKF